MHRLIFTQVTVNIKQLATVNIRELCISEGSLPRRATQLVLDWAELHQAELLADWDLCQANQHPNPIDPLK